MSIPSKAIFGENQGNDNYHGLNGTSYSYTGDGGQTNRHIGGGVECAKTCDGVAEQRNPGSKWTVPVPHQGPPFSGGSALNHPPRLGITPPGNENTTEGHARLNSSHIRPFQTPNLNNLNT